MKPRFNTLRMLRNLLRDERGAILLITTVYLPVIVGMFTLAVDMSYVLRTRNALQITAEAAALAATAQLPDPTVSCGTAKDYATKNMDPGRYGYVLRQNNGTDCSDVVLGTWPQNCAPMTNCFSPLPSGQDCVSFKCNAVKVTTRMATSNGNTLQLAFASMIGISSYDVTATAIAVFGNTLQPWDISIVQDISASFTRPSGNSRNQGALPDAKDADKALLGCMAANSPAGSRLGITTFAGTATVNQSPLTVSGNVNSLNTKIDNISQCYNGGGQNPNNVPSCNTGTDIGTAIKTAVGEYTSHPNQIDSAQKSIVIVTDGLPNEANGCTSGDCSPQGYAMAQADAAWQQGVNIFAIYYCGGNCNSSTANNAANWLARLTRGSGIFLKTPDPSNLQNLMGQVCASQPHRLVW